MSEFWMPLMTLSTQERINLDGTQYVSNASFVALPSSDPLQELQTLLILLQIKKCVFPSRKPCFRCEGAECLPQLPRVFSNKPKQ